MLEVRKLYAQMLVINQIQMKCLVKRTVTPLPQSKEGMGAKLYALYIMILDRDY
jgi:hypothetical protein